MKAKAMNKKTNKIRLRDYWQAAKLILKSVRQYKTVSILSPIFVSLEVVCECIIPLVTSYLVNALQDMQNMTNLQPFDALNQILIYCAILFPLAIASLVFGLLSGKFSATAAVGFAKNVRHDMFAKIQNFSFENIDKYATSGLVTRITTDVFYCQMAYMSIIRIAVRGPLMIIFSMIMSFILAPQLAWVFLFVIPILGVVLTLIILKASPIFIRVFKQFDDLNDRIEENIKGIRVVKTYVRSEYEKELFRQRAEAVRDNFIKADKIFVLSNPTMQFAIWLMITICVYLGGSYILDGQIEIGALNAINLYGTQSLFNIMMLTTVLISITMASTSFMRIYQILTEEPTIKNPSEPVYEVNDGSIIFKNVSFKYHKDAERYALKDVNLTIKSGETIGIIGGTGSAKSTLVNLIPRLYDTTEGEIIVGGHDVREYDIKTLRDNVSCVLQKNVLFSGTIKDNLKWGNMEASDEEVEHAARLACADDFINSFKDGYNHIIEQGGTNVSGGQKQRLCIARALLKNPKILILDDSTSAVDTKTDARIRKAFREYIPEVTKLIIAQRIASVEDADRIIVMNDGVIDAIGTHEELLKTNKIYQECYISQTKKGALA